MLLGSCQQRTPLPPIRGPPPGTSTEPKKGIDHMSTSTLDVKKCLPQEEEMIQMEILLDNRDEQPELPRWATLTEVSQALSVPRDAVRSAARRALKQGEIWVRKEGGKILLDTTSDSYQEHAKRWQQGQQEWDDFPTDLDAEYAALFPREEQQPVYHWYPSPPDGYRQWEEFCQWLASQGLCVSFNLLEGNPATTLSWQWGELHSTKTYQDIKACVIAALDARMQQHTLLQEHMPTSIEPASLAMQRRGWRLKQRRWPFSW
jgi:hypothetical protein